MAAESVKLLGYWASPYALRVKWALKLKGIQYEYVEENLQNKSPLLLQYNPVYKKIPVLVHNGKPLAESLLIIKYIDEVWKQNPLLPEDPYERANTQFWAKFFDEKIGIWGRITEEIVGVNLIDADTMPLLTAWLNNFLKVPVIKECIPSRDKLLEHVHKILTVSST